jgi:hypothetical protein
MEDVIARLESEGRLHFVEPVLPAEPIRRRLLVSEAIWTLLENPPRIWATRLRRLRADFESFVVGNVISVSLTPFKAQTAYMGLLAPTADGVWDVRSRDPSPALRVLGQFACRDTFVALVLASRSVRTDLGIRGPLGGRASRAWRDAILDCRTTWQNLFLELQPVQGGKIGECLSGGYHIVGDG